MKTLRRLLLALATLAVLGVAALAGTSWYYGGDDGMGCARCHEIRPMVDAWAASSHRSVDVQGLPRQLLLGRRCACTRRTSSACGSHSRGETPEQIRIRHRDVAPLVERCGACHRQERADWESGPHGAPYAAIFLNPEHNANQQLMDDCLRCHAMHFEGGIRDLVTPARPEGAVDVREASEYAGLPAMPCLACHAVHRKGEPARRRGATAGSWPAPRRRSSGPRSPSTTGVRSSTWASSGCPMPAMKEGDRPVKMSPDRRQALCYQCHAPRAGNQVFSGDDRTPVGVHEGLSCLACHAKHGQKTRASCAGCHPRLSNCGIDVEKMDTTFKSPESPHDVHRVACLDCHPKGVPKKKDGRE